MNKFAKILMTGSLLWYFGEGMFGPLIAIFTEQIGGNILEITWAWAIYLFVTGVVMIFAGKISDEKIKKEKLMVMGYALNSLFTFGYLFVDTPIKLFIVQGGLGFAWALSAPTWDALYAKHEDRKHDGEAWGLAEGLPKITASISIVIGGLIISYFSFKFLFLTMGTIQIIATIYQTKVLWVKNKNKKNM